MEELKIAMEALEGLGSEAKAALRILRDHQARKCRKE